MQVQSLGRDGTAAAEAVCDAVRFAQTVQHEMHTHALIKPDASPVTVMDFAVQALLVARLTRDFPGDPFVAEEDAAALRAPSGGASRQRVVELVRRMVPDAAPEQVLSWVDLGQGESGPRFWTLDPIDGTKGLLRGGQYVIAAALVIDGIVHIAAVGCPRLSVTTGPASPADPADAPQHALVTAVEDDAAGGVAVAVRGRGAWWTSLRGGSLMRLAVSGEAHPGRARALHSYERRHGDIALVERVLRGLGSDAPPILMDSQAKHVLLSAGAAELLIRRPPDPGYHEAIWDQAAGSLLIEEAGGRVTDLAGRPLDFTTGRRLLRNTGLLASNGLLHDAVLEAVRQGDAGRLDAAEV